MNLEEAVLAVTSGRRVESGFDGPRAPNGEKFVSLTASGVKPQGRTYSVLYAFPQDAIDAYTRELREYTASAGVVYWRRFPELFETQAGGVSYYQVYSRLAVE